jgi:hypothetical protein
VYPGLGGNAGNVAYRADVEVPPSRYMSDYGVMASATKPPYTTLTAYDLNRGEIKWQVPNGDHAPTIAAGGPSDTGGLAARNGMVVTRSGLVFHAGGDGKFRAYDDETGKVLWTGTFLGNAPGVPVSYESKGPPVRRDDFKCDRQCRPSSDDAWDGGRCDDPTKWHGGVRPAEEVGDGPREPPQFAHAQWAARYR